VEEKLRGIEGLCIRKRAEARENEKAFWLARPSRVAILRMSRLLNKVLNTFCNDV